jgi:DNA-directed RNA polymerase III subunit RPC6
VKQKLFFPILFLSSSFLMFPLHSVSRCVSFISIDHVKTSKDEANVMLFAAVPEDERLKLKNLDRNSVIVYRMVEEKGGNGIWRKEIKTRAHLPDTELKKVIDGLISRQLIRELKSAATKNKKTYILFDISPGGDHVGHIWAADKNEFDSVMVHHISVAIYNAVKAASLLRMGQLEKMFVDNPEILKNGKCLNQKHVLQVLDTLKYDGLVELLEDHTAGEQMIKLARQPHAHNHLTEVPCGKCPVYDACGDVGDITPVTCPYFQRWLDF